LGGADRWNLRETESRNIRGTWTLTDDFDRETGEKSFCAGDFEINEEAYKGTQKPMPQIAVRRK